MKLLIFLFVSLPLFVCSAQQDLYPHYQEKPSPEVPPWLRLVAVVAFLLFSWFFYWALSRLCRIGFVKKDGKWIPDPKKYVKNNNGYWIRKK